MYQEEDGESTGTLPLLPAAFPDTPVRFRKDIQKMGLKEFLKTLFRQTSPEALPTLDLHGLSVKASLRLTEEFVTASFRAGISPVRIIYGKGINSPEGKGVLREVIPRWCEKEGKTWVVSYQREVDARGGDGSILLFLRDKADPEIEWPRDHIDSSSTPG
jgi:DNA-nicking Smr family endonuclease